MRVKRAGLASLPERVLRRAQVWECCQRRTAPSLLTRRIDGAPGRERPILSDGASCMSLASRRDEAGTGAGGGAGPRDETCAVREGDDEGEACSWRRISRAVARRAKVSC